jgi:hypothetical protein
MSVRLPPFRIGDDSGETDRIPRSITLARLREALEGRDAFVTQSAALRLVAASDLPDKYAVLAQAARNQDLGIEERRQAIILLAYANVAESQPVLLEALAGADAAVRAAAAKGLGWIGSAAAYEPLVTAMRGAANHVARQAEWAARLIAHREGLPAPELQALRTTDVVDFAGERQPIQIAPARPERMRLCLDAIARHDFRLRLAPASARELKCARNDWMLLLTEDANRHPGALADRRSIAAAIALFIAEDNNFSIAMIALVEPGGRLVVCRSTGEALFAGELSERPDATFSLQALTRPGAFPLMVEGSVKDGTLDFRQAIAGSITVPKRRPTPLDVAIR